MDYWREVMPSVNFSEEELSEGSECVALKTCTGFLGVDTTNPNPSFHRTTTQRNDGATLATLTTPSTVTQTCTCEHFALSIVLPDCLQTFGTMHCHRVWVAVSRNTSAHW